MDLAKRELNALRAGPLRRDRPVASPAYDWVVVLLSAWFVAGVFVDGWAHNHNAGIETFFTPWHAILYSGFLAVGGFIVASLFIHRLQGYAWTNALPVGYDLALLGSVIFAVGGVGDLIWHTLFGIEANIDALYSPTHLTLALGGFLVLTGPLRAAWGRLGRPGQTAPYPAVLSLMLAFCILTFFTQPMHPFLVTDTVRAGRGLSSFSSQALGVASILLQSALLAGVVLLLLRRWKLPTGSLLLFIGINLTLMVWMNFRNEYALIPAALLGALAAEAFNWVLRPGPEALLRTRFFVFLTPAALYLFYFLDLLARHGVNWTVHLWAGSIFLAGITGLLVSYLVFPPALPEG